MLEWSNERKARLIGTLFHDIGKFQYRAEKTDVSHEENSARFIREHLQKHKCLKPFLEQAIKIASTHHQSTGDYAVRQADQAASGEREKEEIKEARRPLYSIFNHISNIKKNVPNTSKKMSFKPGPLSLTDIFPEEFQSEITKQKLRDLHKPHWETFLKEIDAIPDNLSFKELYNTLLSVMEKWTSRISSAGFKTLPDISLYDHSRVTAAYADCIKESTDKEKPFLVVEGDISGIQSFIYNIANLSESEQKGTAKTLRGRSFLIGLYTEAVAQFLLDELNLLNVHLLLNGGGGFTLLAPNIKSILASLPQLRKEINQWLFKEFDGQIGLILVWQSFSVEEVQKFNLVKRTMLQKIADAKFQPNIDFISKDEFWGPTQYDDQKIRVCNSCGAYYYQDDNQKEKKCAGCIKQREIGQVLPHANTLLLIRHKKQFHLTIDGICEIPIPELNQTWILVRNQWGKNRDIDLIRLLLKVVPEDATIDLIRINNLDFNDPLFLSINDASSHSKSYQFKFLGNTAPKDSDGDILSFEELAKKSDGYPLLGVLRMDVDSLGAIFAYGFEEPQQTISRIANLSRLLVQFFSGYLNHLAQEHDVYITYSGGDDLFAVGGWTQIIDFAIDVQKDFQKFVSYNPHITISGGMTIVRPSYPIRLAAQQAGTEEERAKELDNGSQKAKDAFSIFGEAFHWDELDELLQWSNQIVEYIQNRDNDIALRSLIRYFKQIRDESFYPDGTQDIFWIPRVKHKIYYALKRRAGLGSKEFESTEKRQLAQLLSPVIHNSNFLNRIEFPASYILLKTRQKKW
ncbi:MAG: type III-A CRISPR-associated protein Cas10/Csm1 [Candidatus Helarchaeota archaeon]